MLRRPSNSRREFLKSSVAGIATASLGCGVSSRSFCSTRTSNIIAGAIRWDAWYTEADASLAAQHSLSSPKYYKRAPFFCRVNADAQVGCIGNAREMDAEIHAAARGGLKYWAFVWYGQDSSLRTAWNLYSQSSHRHLIKWCGIVGLSDLGSVPFSSN